MNTYGSFIARKNGVGFLVTYKTDNDNSTFKKKMSIWVVNGWPWFRTTLPIHMFGKCMSKVKWTMPGLTVNIGNQTIVKKYKLSIIVEILGNVNLYRNETCFPQSTFRIIVIFNTYVFTGDDV